MATNDIWKYRDPALTTTDLRGFTVDAADGYIGYVEEYASPGGRSYVVLNTGPWNLGQKVLLPAGLVTEADVEEERLRVDRSIVQIGDAPALVVDYSGDAYLRDIAQYYAGVPTASHR